MALNLLLDNNILKNLVSKTEFGYYLTELNFSVRKNHVKLLYPEKLKLEWAKHKEIERASILKAFKSHEKEIRALRAVKAESADFEQDKIEDYKADLLSQLDVIDDLLDNFATFIETNDDVKVLVFNQKEANRKPFGDRDKDNTNDAVIIFSVLDYLQKSGDDQLYFVSNDTGEFSSGVKPGLVIHPDIAVLFPTVNINYFTDMASLYLALDNLKIPRYEKEVITNKINNVIPIDKTKSLLHQLHEYFDKRSDQLIVIPKRILTEHYPIIISDRFSLHHKPFTLVTDNKELFDLLTQVEITANPIVYTNNPFIKNEEDEKKIRCIFKYMYINYLTQVAFKQESGVYIKYSPGDKPCDCSLCLFNRLNLSESLKRINTIHSINGEEERIEFKIRDAYTCYKLGEFYLAATSFKKLYDERKLIKDLYTYIISFNLYNLGILLERNYWDDAEAKKLSTQLKQIDLEKIFRECKTYANKSLIEWIHEKEFYKTAFSKMHEKVKEITDRFYAQNSGFNDNTRGLMEYYHSVDNFLNRNYIIYDIYKEFYSISTLLVDGLLTSYGSSKFLGGKLQYLSDSLLRKLMFSGTAEEIRKLFYRYKLDNIAYEFEGEEKNTFLVQFLFALEDYPALVINYEKYVKKQNDYLWEKYAGIMSSSLTLLGIVKFESPVINTVSQKLISFLAQQKHLQGYNLLKHLRFFLFQKRRDLSDENLREYFVLALQNDFFHSDNYLETLFNILFDRKLKLSLNDNEFQFVRKGFLSDEKLDAQTESFYALGYIFSSITSEEQKSEIREFVNRCLINKMEHGKYYLANMFDIIDPIEEFNNQYFQQISEIVSKGQRNSPFIKRDFHFDSRIDGLFNFCLKHDLAIPTEIRDKLPLLGPYYTWLNDMENFDYTEFDTEWLTAHFTLYFKRKYRQSTALKQHLLSLIKALPNNEIERTFILIYCFDD